MTEKRVLITGAGGQLAWELERSAPVGTAVNAPTIDELDITNARAVRLAVEAFSPDWILNAAAYTAVDRAESEPDLAFSVNGDGARNLALAAQDRGIRMLHVSTDFVFDGRVGTPYGVDQAPCPATVYGRSKRQGEEEVMNVLGSQGTVVRTAWLYSAHGGNFVKTMLRLMTERDRLGVVADQVGTPTWARGLAWALWAMMERGFRGFHHWTDAGVASWFDFAVAIQEEALSLGLIGRSIPIEPIPTAAYPTPAVRPAYSVLDKTVTWGELGKAAEQWRVALRGMLRELMDA